MPRNRIAEQNIFLLCTTPDLVDYERHALDGQPIRHDSDMGQAVAQVPGDDVAGGVRRWGGGDGAADHPCRVK